MDCFEILVEIMIVFFESLVLLSWLIKILWVGLDFVVMIGFDGWLFEDFCWLVHLVSTNLIGSFIEQLLCLDLYTRLDSCIEISCAWIFVNCLIAFYNLWIYWMCLDWLNFCVGEGRCSSWSPTAGTLTGQKAAQGDATPRSRQDDDGWTLRLPHCKWMLHLQRSEAEWLANRYVYIYICVCVY